MKITFSLIFLVSFLYANAQTPNSWTQIADFGGPPRAGAISFSVNGFGYLGCTGNYLDTTTDYLWQYNPHTDSWARKASFPGHERGEAVCFVIDLKVYYGLGNSTLSSGDFWEYDPIADLWTQKNDFPGGYRAGAVGFSIGSKGYVGLGIPDTLASAPTVHDLWEYDPSTDNWTRKADVPIISRRDATSFSINDKGYVCFGADATHPYNVDLWQYSPDSNLWIRKADIPSIYTYSPSYFVLDGYGYICTGYDTLGNIHNYLWKYDPSVDTWIQKDSFPGTARTYAISFALDHHGYFGTGYQISPPLVFKDLWQYTPDSVYTGILEADINKLILYPNPATYKLYLNTSIQDIDITITDITGRVYILPYSQREIDVSSLSAGVYCLRLQDRSGTIVRRFVKE